MLVTEWRPIDTAPRGRPILVRGGWTDTPHWPEEKNLFGCVVVWGDRNGMKPIGGWEFTNAGGVAHHPTEWAEIPK